MSTGFALGIVGLSLVPLVFVSFLVRYFGRRIHDRFESVQAQLSEISAVVQENLSGARVVRAYAQEPYEMARFQAANEEYLRRNRQLIRMYGSLYPGIQLLMGTGAVLVLWLGGRMVVANAITIGEFVAFNMLAGQISAPVLRLAQLWQDFQQFRLSIERLGDIINTPTERSLGPQPKLPASRGDIRFENIVFRYRPGGQEILRDVSLEIRAGEVVCILEAMKMENHIPSTRDGEVTELPIRAGQVVETGQTLAVID